MFELVQLTQNCYFIQSPARIGLVCLRDCPDEVVLIDSGSDRDAGKKVKRILDSRGWKLKAIYNTHSHADHIGGNRYLQEQTGCAVYAPGMERDFTLHPLLEPAFLYGGFPPGDLRHKFLMAQESRAEALTEQVLPPDLEPVPLPGHSFDMTGFRAGDVVYLADCLSSEATLEKYGISFLVDVEAYLDTLSHVMEMQAEMFVPSHAEPVKDIRPLAKRNMDRVWEIAGIMEEMAREPLTEETMLQRLFARYNLKMKAEQHALVGSTVRSYLAWELGRGRMERYFENNLCLFRTL